MVPLGLTTATGRGSPCRLSSRMFGVRTNTLVTHSCFGVRLLDGRWMIRGPSPLFSLRPQIIPPVCRESAANGSVRHHQPRYLLHFWIGLTHIAPQDSYTQMKRLFDESVGNLRCWHALWQMNDCIPWYLNILWHVWCDNVLCDKCWVLVSYYLTLAVSFPLVCRQCSRRNIVVTFALQWPSSSPWSSEWDDKTCV